LEPKLRIAAKDAVEETWVQFGSNQKIFSANHIKSLTKYAAKFKLQGALYNYIDSFAMYYIIKVELEKICNSINADGSGYLTKEEVIEGYIHVFDGMENASIEAQKIFNLIATEESGHVHCLEFIDNVLEFLRNSMKEDISNAFNSFYEDKDQFVAKQDLTEVVELIGIKDVRWQKTKEHFRNDTVTEISKGYFIEMMTREFLSI